MIKRGVKGVTLLNNALLWAASGVLLATMLMAVANMVLRPLKMPIQGTFELLGLGGALIVAFAAGSSQQARIHIAVDILFDRFPRRLRRVLHALGDLAGGALFAIAAWQMGRFGLTLRATGEISETLGGPVYPVVFAVALGLGAIALTMLLHAVHDWGKR